MEEKIINIIEEIKNKLSYNKTYSSICNKSKPKIIIDIKDNKFSISQISFFYKKSLILVNNSGIIYNSYQNGYEDIVRMENFFDSLENKLYE